MEMSMQMQLPKVIGAQSRLERALNQLDGCRAALALVDGPQTKDNDMNNEQVEVEDDRRCSECGSTEGGNCFYCKDGLG